MLALALVGECAAEVRLAWDPVADSRVPLYQVHYGITSGSYAQQQEVTGTTAVVSPPEPCQTYYFAVRACMADRTTCSGFSNEVSAIDDAYWACLPSRGGWRAILR